jgi:hypothetical protein
MKNTTITHKTGFRFVLLHTPTNMDSFENLSLNTYETYQEACAVAEFVADAASAETIKVTVKYIVAVPLIGQVEVEHINYLP